MYIIILQDESYNKCDHNIIFGGSVTTLSVRTVKVHGDNKGMVSCLLELSIRHR